MKEKLNGYGRSVIGAIIGFLVGLALLAPSILAHGQAIERLESDTQRFEDWLVEKAVTKEDLAQLKADLIRELGK